MSLQDNVAGINEEECIRCGRCHDVCPEEAVRHDSERIPQMVDANIEWAEGLMSKFDSEEEKTALLKRLAKYFKMQTKVAQQSLERLQTLA
jgi:Fe-S-cluster-containing hydrogenase component 2